MRQPQVAGLRFCPPLSQQMNISLQATSGALSVARLSHVVLSKPREHANLVHWSATVSMIFTVDPSPGFSRFRWYKFGVSSIYTIIVHVDPMLNMQARTKLIVQGAHAVFPPGNFLK